MRPRLYPGTVVALVGLLAAVVIMPSAQRAVGARGVPSSSDIVEAARAGRPFADLVDGSVARVCMLGPYGMPDDWGADAASAGKRGSVDEMAVRILLLDASLRRVAEADVVRFAKGTDLEVVPASWCGPVGDVVLDTDRLASEGVLVLAVTP